MRRAVIGLIIFCAALFAAPGGTHGTQFYNSCSLANVAFAEAGASSDVTTTFGVGLDPFTCGRFASPYDRPGEWFPQNEIDFTPPQWYVAADADIPDGTKVGESRWEVVLSLLNNGCNLTLNLNFDLVDATIDRSNPIDPKPPGQPNSLAPLSVKDDDGVPAGARMWPSYLTTIAENRGMNLDQLQARIFGVNTTSVPGTTEVINYLVFKPGATLADSLHTSTALGWPAVSILNNPTGAGSSQDVVDDVCAPFWSEQHLLGDADGLPYRKNPDDGVFNFVTYSEPSPDADDDGIENALDPCPYVPNVSGWDPRAALVQGQTGDPDTDSLPDDCDPVPDTKSTCNSDTGTAMTDEDCDGWENRADNCPLVANEDQTDVDGDAIGDACDQNINTVPPGTLDGQHASVCNVITVTIGSGGANPPNASDFSPCCDPVAYPATAVFPSCPPSFFADVDCDGDTDAFDLLAEMQDIAGTSVPDCAYLEYVGPCDANGDPADLIVFLRALAGFNDPLPAILCPANKPVP